VNYFNFRIIQAKAEPQRQVTPVEFGSPHEANCAKFVDICFSIFSIFIQSHIPSWHVRQIFFAKSDGHTKGHA
jgi:hypothetical protein